MARPAYTEEESARMRSALLDVALALYLDEGIESVTLRQIAAHAGLSHTLVYRYFDSKESLLAAMRVACLDELQQALQEADRPEASPLARVRLVLLGALAFGRDHAPKYRLVFTLPQPDLASHPVLAAKRAEIFDACVNLVREAVNVGELQADALVLTHGLWSLLHGMLGLHTAGQLVHGLTLDQMAAPVLDMLLGPASGALASASRPPVRARTARSTV